jgi:Regulator of chromosome condensation (RCC1) repeat
MMQLGNAYRNTRAHVLHGPAVVSDLFSATKGQVITLDWFSAASADDFAVLGYLLDTDTCTQYEVVDQTGTFTKSDDGTGTYVNAWQNSSVTIPTTKSSYRFVFINGTLDRTGGRWSGASFWLDNISVGYQQRIPFGPVPDKYVGEGTFTVPAKANSGLTAIYTSETPSVCTVTGNVVTLVAPGTCTLAANQPGGEINEENYVKAPQVKQTFNVLDGDPPTATPTITPTFTASPTSTPTPHPFAIKDVAVGASFTLGVLHNGTLVTWGFNREGQASLPRWMASKPVKEVEVGSNYAIALGEDGRVYGWGKDEFGQLVIPTTATSNVRTISASLGHVMAIKNDGSLLIWGRNDFKQRETPLAARRNLIAIGAGHSHSLAVKSDGKVIAWGRNTWGQTNVPSTLTNVIAVAGGFDHSLALRSNGTIVCWGRNHEGQCRIPAGLKDVIKISAGVSYSMALTRDGKVFAWGRNDYGQAKVPTGISPVGAIAAGYVNSVIGMQDANVRAFGNSMHGSLVSRTPTVTP